MKVLWGLVCLACVPAVLARNNAGIPSEKVAEFVVEKLDVTTLPSALRPKSQKGKKTFGDYGYVTRQLDDKEAVVDSTPGGAQINIRVLEQKSSGIYVCVQGRGRDGSSGQFQRVLLLKLKNANGFLKSSESSKEFDGCLVIGADPASAPDSYGG